jgi:hypothetical protein
MLHSPLSHNSETDPARLTVLAREFVSYTEGAVLAHQPPRTARGGGNRRARGASSIVPRSIGGPCSAAGTRTTGNRNAASGAHLPVLGRERFVLALGSRFTCLHPAIGPRIATRRRHLSSPLVSVVVSFAPVRRSPSCAVRRG